MNPYEMDYEYNDHGSEDDSNDDDNDLEDADYILGTTDADGNGDDEEGDDEDGGDDDDDDDDDDEDEGLMEEAAAQLPNIQFRLVHEGEDLDIDDDGAPTRHFLTMPSGIPFRVEVLGITRRDPRRHLIKGAEPVPSPEGQKLMRGGQFGSEEFESYPSRPNPHKLRHPHFIRLLEREIGAYRGERARIGHQLLAQSLLPSTKADFVMHYDDRCYSGQFSHDGNFFYSCSQDFRVRMYDTSNPYDWKHYKTVKYPGGRWTITDATLSPDNKMLAYSSIDSMVYVSNTSSEMEERIELDFEASARGRRNAMYRDQFGIWSIRFSGDGREMVAGANDNNLYVYDIETRTTVLKMSGHQNDVNAVCFADVDSPHILFSGSDDTTLKVWDRRSMASGEVGVFCGHLEGLTYIDSKGDGRYVLSNAKDQTMKLWDIRKMMSPSTFATLKYSNYSTDYDYRSERYNYPPARHQQDSSVVTYRSHSVLRTLIRCHFSPPTSSGSRYVYTGSSDGKVYIYNLDATIASIIDVYKATSETRPWCEDLYGGWGHEASGWDTCVRDASWHPSAGVLAATSWNGYGAGTGSVSLHGWGVGEEEQGDEGPVRLNCCGKRDPALYGESEWMVEESSSIDGEN